MATSGTAFEKRFPAARVGFLHIGLVPNQAPRTAISRSGGGAGLMLGQPCWSLRDRSAGRGNPSGTLRPYGMTIVAGGLTVRETWRTGDQPRYVSSVLHRNPAERTAMIKSRSQSAPPRSCTAGAGSLARGGLAEVVGRDRASCGTGLVAACWQAEKGVSLINVDLMRPSVD